MTRSEWINIIGIAVAILTVCFLVIQQTSSIRSELHRVESRLDAKIDGVESRLDTKIDGVESRLEAKIDGVETRLEAKIESIGTRFSQIEQNQAQLEGEVGILKEVALDSAASAP